MYKRETTSPFAFFFRPPNAICQSIGNIPVAYMTAFNGWVHDRYGKIWMLNAEAILALAGIAGGLIALQQINTRRVPVPHEIPLCP